MVYMGRDLGLANVPGLWQNYGYPSASGLQEIWAGGLHYDSGTATFSWSHQQLYSFPILQGTQHNISASPKQWLFSKPVILASHCYSKNSQSSNIENHGKEESGWRLAAHPECIPVFYVAWRGRPHPQNSPPVWPLDLPYTHNTSSCVGVPDGTTFPQGISSQTPSNLGS